MSQKTSFSSWRSLTWKVSGWERPEKISKQAEPLIRDSEFISIDMGAVRHADAPGASTPSPNGFFGDELCQITRYAGLSEQANILGFFELNPSSDINGQTAHLAAQAAWYFLEGLSHRIRENPVDTPEHIKEVHCQL